MLVRLVAISSASSCADSCMLEDRSGRLYLLDPGSERLEPLECADADVLMQWFEPSQSSVWHAKVDLIQKLKPTWVPRQGVAPTTVMATVSGYGAVVRRSLEQPSVETIERELFDLERFPEAFPVT